MDPARLLRIVLDLGPQTGNVLVDRARGGKGGVAPNDIEEPVPRHDLAWILQQQAQHREFLGRQENFLGAAKDALLHKIQAYLSQFDLAEDARLLLHTPPKGADTGEQLLTTEWL